jgi:hypothetical protein
MPERYIIVNGIKKLNPEFKKTTTVADSEKALVILSCPEDFKGKGAPPPMAESTESSLEILRDQSYVDGFQIVDVQKQQLVQDSIEQDLFSLFSAQEVPIGTINKLFMILEDELYKIQDDSGSMMEATDTVYSAASEYIKARRELRENHPKNKENYIKHAQYNMKAPQHSYMTRWEEAEERWHTLIDILAYIPNPLISMSFLNRPQILSFTHKGLTPAEFAQKAHREISEAFDVYPTPVDLTPVYKSLDKAFTSPLIHGKRRLIYMAGDGRPSPRVPYVNREQWEQATLDEIKMISTLVKNRKNPELFPLTFLSCTNIDKDVEWTKELEEEGPWIAELDDFFDERNEIIGDQGPAFPYNKGLWKISNLVAAICPDDLDALDESTPLSSFTLTNLLGYRLTEQEYHHYWTLNPKASNYNHLYPFFLNEPCSGKELVRKEKSGELQKEQQLRIAQSQAAAYPPQIAFFQPASAAVYPDAPPPPYSASGPQ